jgi:non-canonical (house-cleaning) NTP pyrophosphatase
VVVTAGVTGEETVLVNAASENQVKVPEAQVAFKAVLSPVQIFGVVAETNVGAAGVGTIVTVTEADGLLHNPFTHAA